MSFAISFFIAAMIVVFLFGFILLGKLLYKKYGVDAVMGGITAIIITFFLTLLIHSELFQ